MMKYCATALAVLIAATAHAQTMGPAPAGDPKVVGARVIAEADHPCPKVLDAVRLNDGSLRAVCSNGEAYRVFAFNGKSIAMRCSAAAKLGVGGC